MNADLRELELLSEKIESNTASLEDYKKYERILTEGGLSHQYIFSSLRKAGFNSWEEFYEARQQKQKDNTMGIVVGSIIGLGLGLLILFGLIDNDKK